MTHQQPTPHRPRRVVVLGGGFAGYWTVRTLARKLDPSVASVSLVSDTDAMLYQPLLPNVAVGAIDPRDIMVPLNDPGLRAELVPGRAESVDKQAREVTVSGPAGRRLLPYDILVVAVGSVTRLLDIPGLRENAIGFKTPVEALYMRDRVLARLETAAETTDVTVRRAALTFLVVGAGYAGTELVAQMALMTTRLLPLFPTLRAQDVRWMLVDVADAVMPELGPELGSVALELLRARGVDVRLGTSLKSVTDTTVVLTDGTTLDCSTLVWCAGVTPNPAVATLDLPTTKGRLVVQPDLSVPGHPEIFAVGDAAAVPDLTASASAGDHPPLCPPTAQHAMRQGPAAARNVVRSLAGEPRKDYRHHDLGLVVDLGGSDAVAKPLGLALRGRLAKVLTRGYHVYALPTARRRARVLSDWLLAGRRPDDVSLGLVQSTQAAALAAHEHRG